MKQNAKCNRKVSVTSEWLISQSNQPKNILLQILPSSSTILLAFCFHTDIL